jgi:hypothetical protein
VWVRRVRLLIVSPDSTGTACPLSGRNSTYRPVQISGAGSLKRHYEQGSPPNWPEQFISQYATTHPWEDFAETWAHYLHIVDTLEMVAASGMSVRPIVDKTGDHSATVEFDPYFANSIEQLLDSWLPFVFAINNVSRAMGERDLYPFVIAPPVVKKLGFVHDLIHGHV